MHGGSGIARKAGAVRNGRSGRFVPTEKLTPQQAEFVRNYVLNGGLATLAAEHADYRHASKRAWELMRNPVIIAAINSCVLSELHTEGAVVGKAVLIQIARKETALDKDRIAAAKSLLDAARLTGYSQQHAESDGDMPLNEMTRDELARFIAAEREAINILEEVSNGPNTIDVTPGLAPDVNRDSAETPTE